MALASASTLAAYAQAVATGIDPRYPAQAEAFAELSGLMCWSAVIRCALNAGAITDERAQLLERLDWKEDFSSFVPRSDPRVRTADEMRQVPAGAFLAFIRVDPPDPYFRFVNDLRGKRHIVHAMLSLGGGMAAGNKNSCVGIGRHVGWEVLDLAAGLNWLTDTRYDAINGYPRHVQARMPLRIRYRPLAEFQRDAGPGNARRLQIQTLPPDRCTVVQPGEVWDVGPLADCVALAAVKPAHALTTHNAASIFLWHVNGGLVRPDMMPYRALTDFLGDSNADWVFVHGRSASSRQGRASFQAQSFDEELVDGLNTLSGHVVRHLGGSRLLIDATGRILNEAELTTFRP